MSGKSYGIAGGRRHECRALVIRLLSDVFYTLNPAFDRCFLLFLDAVAFEVSSSIPN